MRGAFLRAKSGWCRNASGSRRHEGATIKRCHMNLPDFIAARRRPSQRCATTSPTEHPNASPLAELCKPSNKDTSVISAHGFRLGARRRIAVRAPAPVTRLSVRALLVRVVVDDRFGSSRRFGDVCDMSALPSTTAVMMQCRERQKGAISGSDCIHSITSSAVASSDGGTVRPSMRAVEALMTSSNLLDCTTGKSAGLAPLRMRPT